MDKLASEMIEAADILEKLGKFKEASAMDRIYKTIYALDMNQQPSPANQPHVAPQPFQDLLTKSVQGAVNGGGVGVAEASTGDPLAAVKSKFYDIQTLVLNGRLDTNAIRSNPQSMAMLKSDPAGETIVSAMEKIDGVVQRALKAIENPMGTMDSGSNNSSGNKDDKGGTADAKALDQLNV